MIPCQRKLLSHQHSCTGFERIMRAIRTSNWLIVLAVVLTLSSVSSTVRDSKHSRELSTLPSMGTPYRCGRGRAYAANAPSTDLRTNTSAPLVGVESTKMFNSLCIWLSTIRAVRVFDEGTHLKAHCFSLLSSRCAGLRERRYNFIVIQSVPYK